MSFVAVHSRWIDDSDSSMTCSKPLIRRVRSAGLSLPLWHFLFPRTSQRVQGLHVAHAGPRARLYAQSRDALHAADQLRIPALGRIGRALGLGTAATAGEIADAAAATTGLERSAVRGTLIDDIPRGDADLVLLDARLRHLEGAVLAAARPERNTR